MSFINFCVWWIHPNWFCQTPRFKSKIHFGGTRRLRCRGTQGGGCEVSPSPKIRIFPWSVCIFIRCWTKFSRAFYVGVNIECACEFFPTFILVSSSALRLQTTHSSVYDKSVVDDPTFVYRLKRFIVWKVVWLNLSADSTQTDYVAHICYQDHVIQDQGKDQDHDRDHN